jgi:hypothetical protein
MGRRIKKPTPPAAEADAGKGKGKGKGRGKVTDPAAPVSNRRRRHIEGKAPNELKNTRGDPTSARVLECPELAGWCGKTPQELLQEHCRRAGFGAPRYKGSAGDAGAQCAVYLAKGKVPLPAHLEGAGAVGRAPPPAEDAPPRSEASARQWAAAAALGTLFPTLQLQLILPFAFRAQFVKGGEVVKKSGALHDFFFFFFVSC